MRNLRFDALRLCSYLATSEFGRVAIILKMPSVLMNPKANSQKNYFALACLFAAMILGAMILAGCRKPAPEAQPQSTPATPEKAASTPTPTPTPAQQAAPSGEALSTVAVHILNAADRGGGVVLRSECGPHGLEEQYYLPHKPALEPMDQALQAVSEKYQNIFWRESPGTGVRIADAKVKARLLAVRVREFRIVEDREPDRVMTLLWQTPEVKAFLHRSHARFARRADGVKKVLSPPMIVEMKNATVAAILDRVAAGYRQNPPKVWVYQECTEKKETLIDVQMR
ncbi:MAG TPA: hypothetical protein VJW20_13905 [Candidatus Angelobacter sp.]|nr:hypothetical protein [Candidatus Angelobacter sp.]